MAIFLKIWLKFICMWNTSNPHGKPFLCLGDKPVTEYNLYWESCHSCSTELHRQLLNTEVWLAVFLLHSKLSFVWSCQEADEPVLGRGEDPRKSRVTCWCLCCALEDEPGPTCWVMHWHMGSDFITVPSKKSELSVSLGCLKRQQVLAADTVRLWTIFRWFPPHLAHLKLSLQGQNTWLETVLCRVSSQCWLCLSFSLAILAESLNAHPEVPSRK